MQINIFIEGQGKNYLTLFSKRSGSRYCKLFYWCEKVLLKFYQLKGVKGENRFITQIYVKGSNISGNN